MIIMKVIIRSILVLWMCSLSFNVYADELSDLVKGNEGKVFCYNFDDECGGDITKYEDIYKGSGNIWVYIMGDEVFKTFSMKPTIEFLKESFYMPNEQVEVYEYFERVGNEFNKLLLNGDKYILYKSKDKCYFNDGVFFEPNHEELEFLSVENIQSILYEEGIAEIVRERVVISNFGNPLMIWIATENNYYVMVYENGVIKSDTKNYIVYNSEDFSNKFSAKEGKLIIDNKDYDAVTFFGNNINIALRPVLEHLFGEIKWLNEDKAVLFQWNGNDYKWKLNGEHWTCFENGKDVTLEGKWSYILSWIYIKDGKIMINSTEVLRNWLKMFNMELRVDDINYLITIS